MTKEEAKQQAESRLASWLDNAFYDDDNFLAENPLVLKEMQKARNRCLRVLGYESKPLYTA